MLTGQKLKTRSEKEAKALRAIAHPHRLAILHLLAESDMRLMELGLHMGLPQSLVAHHVGILDRTGLIGKFQVGARTFYRLNKKILDEVKKSLSL